MQEPQFEKDVISPALSVLWCSFSGNVAMNNIEMEKRAQEQDY